MSEYTIQIKTIVDNYSIGIKGIREKIKTAKQYIFDFDFPMYNESYRDELEIKILMHYYMREIGAETVGLWKLFLEERLNLIMPYYNDLYKSVDVQYNILHNTNLNKTYDENTSQTENSNTNITENVNEEIKGTNQKIGNNTKNLIINTETTEKRNGGYDDTIEKEIHHPIIKEITSSITEKNTNNVSGTKDSLNSDLPQATATGIDYGTVSVHETDSGTNTENKTKNTTDNENIADDLEENSTISRTTTDNIAGNENKTEKNIDSINEENISNENKNNNLTRNDTNKLTNEINRAYNTSTTGNNGNKSFPELIMEYRQAIINIDRLIINDLSDLFMQIY